MDFDRVLVSDIIEAKQRFSEQHTNDFSPHSQEC